MRISDWSSDGCSSDLEQRHQIGKASRVVKGDDVGSRHSDVDHPSFAEMQQVLQHLTLDEAQVALAAAVLVMLLYSFLDLVAKTSEARRGGIECVSTCRSRVAA